MDSDANNSFISVEADDITDADFLPSKDDDESGETDSDSDEDSDSGGRCFVVYESELLKLIKYCPKCGVGLDKSLIRCSKRKIGSLAPTTFFIIITHHRK